MQASLWEQAGSIAVLAMVIPLAFKVPDLCNALCDRLRYGRQIRPVTFRGLDEKDERAEHPAQVSPIR